MIKKSNAKMRGKMSRRHHQSKEEQIYNKEHGAAPFHHEKMPYPKNAPIIPQDIKIKADKAAEDDSSIPHRTEQVN